MLKIHLSVNDLLDRMCSRSENKLNMIEAVRFEFLWKFFMENVHNGVKVDGDDVYFEELVELFPTEWRCKFKWASDEVVGTIFEKMTDDGLKDLEYLVNN